MNITISPADFVCQLNDNRPAQAPFRFDTAHASPTSNASPARWPRLMNRKVAAEYLGISERTFDEWVSNGTVPAHSIAPTQRTKRWDKETLDKHLDTTGSNGGKASPSVNELLAAHTAKQSREVI